MFYITYRVKRIPRQITIDDIYNDRPIVDMPNTDIVRTFTKAVLKADELPHHYTPTRTLDSLVATLEQCKALQVQDMYHTFQIPKKTGGLRTIQAPNEQLKGVQQNIKETLGNITRNTFHNAAHAYVIKRSALTAMQEHQANESKWFLKLDIKDFFGSFNQAFITQQLSQVFPLHAHAQLMDWHVALLDGKLPQGTPISPILTNICMVPIDTEIRKALSKHFIYTRYADDIIISNKYSFKYSDIQNIVSQILSDTPLKIKPEKTRYGSSAGRNWNLGLMLNKDNNITIGYKNKERFKAMVFTFLNNVDSWSREETEKLVGLYNYYKHIEPSFIEGLTTKYTRKMNKYFPNEAKAKLSI